MIGRREVFLGSFATAGLAALAKADPPKVSFPDILNRGFVSGIYMPKHDEVAMANLIISTICTNNYVNVMQALTDIIQKNADSEPYDRRWKVRANPLLVRIWNDMGT